MPHNKRMQSDSQTATRFGCRRCEALGSSVSKVPMIRPASSTDAGALACLAERTFREAFAAENSAADIDSHCATNFSEDIQLKEIGDPNYGTLVADHDGDLIAFAQVRLHSPKKLVAAERPAELHRLYVLEEWRGQGTAHEIMSVLFGAPALNEADALWLSVWEHNPRAIAFYRKYGFKVVGDHVFQVGSDPQRDLVMSVAFNGRPAV